MRLALLIVIIALYVSTIEGATVPTVNPECQSLADIINDIKRRLDQVPLTLLPIPGLNASLPTTLKCYEYPSCTGFNCSGSVYGTHVEFSFNFDYCLKPISANVSLYYPAEKVNFTRTIQHSKEFFISKFNVKIPILSTSIDLPIQLYGKINMVRVSGRVVVSAGIIPKFNIIIPVPLQPFYFLTNQTIFVDTSRCEATTTSLPMTQRTPSRSPQGSTTSAQSGATSSVRPTSRQTTSGLSNTQSSTTTPPGLATNQAVGANGALSGGEIAAIVMGFVALLTIILFAILFVRKRKARQQSQQIGRQPLNANMPSPESTYLGAIKAKPGTKVHAVESNHYKLNDEGNNAKVDHSESIHFDADVKASAATSIHYENFNDATNPEKERVLNRQFEVHVADGIANPHVKSDEQFQF